MKKIENKKVEIPGDINNYFDLILICIRQTPKEGYDIIEMRRRMKVIDALEKEKNFVEIEDTDFISIKKCVNDMRWGIIHQGLIDFVDYITNIKK